MSDGILIPSDDAVRYRERLEEVLSEYEANTEPPMARRMITARIVRNLLDALSVDFDIENCTTNADGHDI